MFLALLTLAHANPAATVQSFFQAQSSGDLPAAWEMICREDKAAEPLALWEKRHNPLWRIAAARTQVDVNDDVAGENPFWVTVTITSPDLGPVAPLLADQVKGSQVPERSLALAIDQGLANGSITRRSSSLRVPVRKQGSWCIDLGLDQRARAMELLDEALQARRDGQPTNALIDAIEAIEPDTFGAVATIQAEAKALRH